MHHTPLENLSLLPSTIQLPPPQIHLLPTISTQLPLKPPLHQLTHQYHFIFIHSPPSLPFLTINPLTASDSVLIPLQSEYYPLQRLTH
ncbi:AAA family ATPase, partial [Siminovitchia fortis]|uniref:AAA family ATPase n=1 Tax=Siminovitchia fortis TaxID=254758 RepID=UPI0036F35A24